jgi:CrcB protein
MTTLLVALGGALGAVLRYRIGVVVGVRGFPWATLSVNLIGTFALAAFLGSGADVRLGIGGTALVAAGLLGGFTTFSAFGYETLMMLRDERIVAAALYGAFSVIGGVAAAAVGYSVARAVS